MPATVGILVFDDVELLDLAGPFEVLASARGADGARLFRVLTIAARVEPITCRGGLRLLPDHGFADHPRLDLLIVPGGAGTERLERDPATLEWVRRAGAEAMLVASVCTGAFVLAAAGLLDGMPATTYGPALAELAARYPAVDVRRGARFTDAGRTATSAGVSAGIDLALHLVRRFHGRAVAAAVADDMEYRWDADADGGGDPA